MEPDSPRRWTVANASCDMQISIDAVHVHITIDAGKYEAYTCTLAEYLDEQAVDGEISLREVVRSNAGAAAADEVADEVRQRLQC